MPQTPIYSPNIAAYGAKNSLNITTATVIKAARGTLLGIQVIVAGSDVGTANDIDTVGDVAAANQVSVIPNAVGPVDIPACGIPCLTGIVITPGTGQTVAVFYI